MNNLIKLNKLCIDVQNKWEVTYGVNEIEHLLLKVLNFIKSHPESFEDFSKYFVDRLKRNHKFPLEIIIFAMRELQWPQIKRAAIEVKESTNDWRVISTMDDLLSVYELEWEGEDMYKYYSKEVKD